MLRRKLFLALGVVTGVMTLVGCVSPTLRYGMPGVAGVHGGKELEHILALEIKKLSPKSLDKPLKAISVTAPDYPPSIRHAHSGDVLIRYAIGVDGKVTQATARPDDNPALVRLAADAVKQWRFEPPLRGGQPTVVHMNVPFAFRTR